MHELEVFIAVVESGGFTAAASRLGNTVTATSRRVRALEDRLGVRLLNRTTRRLHLTEAGELYYQQVRRIVADLRETEQQLGELAREPRGDLRVSAPLSLGLKRLGPLLAHFARQHPQVRVELLLDDRVVDFVAEGLDMALRIGHLSDSGMVARALLPVARAICAAPSYLAAHGTPAEPRDLTRHQCLRYSNLSAREEWALGGPRGPELVSVQGRYCSNNGDILCEAAVQGLGVVLLPEFIVADALADGRLQRILQPFEPPPFTLYAIYPSRHYVPAKLRLFLNYVTAAAGPTWLAQASQPA